MNRSGRRGQGFSLSTPADSVPYISGRWFEPQGADAGNASTTPNEGRLLVSPVYLPAASLSNLAVYVVTGGAAGAVVRLGIYDDVNGVPTNLKIDAGTVAAVTNNTLASVAASFSLSVAGWYWLAAAVQGAAATRPAWVRMGTVSPRPSIYPAAGTPNGFGLGGWYKDTVSGALPNPMAPSAPIGISGVPVIYGKWA